MMIERPPKQKPITSLRMTHVTSSSIGCSKDAAAPLSAARPAKLRTCPTALTRWPMTRQARTKPSDQLDESRPICCMEAPSNSRRIGSSTPCRLVPAVNSSTLASRAMMGAEEDDSRRILGSRQRTGRGRVCIGKAS